MDSSTNILQFRNILLLEAKTVIEEMQLILSHLRNATMKY